MVASPQPDDVNARLSQLERSLANATNKTLYSASIGQGGITINGNGGIQVTNGTGQYGQFYVGGGFAPPHADGTAQSATVISDEAGQTRFAVWDSSNPSNPGHQQLAMWDFAGRLLYATDVNGGMALPWFTVPLYPRFTPPQNATDTAGSVYGYATISTSTPNIAQGQILWEGRIPYVSHPRIAIDGVWGQASGTVVPTYSLTVGGATVGTWSPGGSNLVVTQVGPWDISSLLGGNTAVQISISVTWTGTGIIAADFLGCYLRQT